MSNGHNFKEGELFYSADNKVYQYVNEIVGSELVCTIRDDGHPFTSDASKKIGNLIKTAPKLYSMLDEIAELAITDDQTIADEMVQKFGQIEMLLAEARGEE